MGLTCLYEYHISISHCLAVIAVQKCFSYLFMLLSVGQNREVLNRMDHLYTTLTFFLQPEWQFNYDAAGICVIAMQCYIYVY